MPWLTMGHWGTCPLKFWKFYAFCSCCSLTVKFRKLPKKNMYYIFVYLAVSVLGNRNMNAVSKHGASLRKRMSGFRFLLNPDFLRLANKINYDHGRGPLTVGGFGSLNLLNPLLLRHCMYMYILAYVYL